MNYTDKVNIIAWIKNETDIHCLATLIQIIAERIDDIEKQNIMGYNATP